MVPVSTRIAIVNQSEACAKSFYMSKQLFDEERFNGRIMGGDPNQTYVRTGDLGFLHNVTRPIGPGNQPVEMQILFVLGSIGETFEINGLNHFPIDIENSIERCHRNIIPGGCAVFQAGGLVVVVVEVFRKAYLASIVPVIVNAVLHEHQIVVDIVAFVGQGDFPRSRLSEKQRGKILASWVTRKLRTIAQFGIRDADGPDSQFQIPGERKSVSIMTKTPSQAGQARASVASESQSSIQPDAPVNTVNRSSGVPELAFSLPPNHYQIDPTGLYDDATPTEKNAGVSLTDRPYTLPEGVVEMPTSNFDEDDRNNPYMTDEKFFDPNADAEDLHKQFGSYSHASSQSDLAPGGPPKLSLMNPDEYSSNNDSTDNTPTSYTATPTPTSARPLSSNALRDDESPYGDQGNPFRNSIPASVPSFDFVASPGPRNPAREQMATASAAYDQVRAAASGRALLPSQQARYPQPDPVRAPRQAPYERQDLPKEALTYSSTYDRKPSGNSLRPDERQSVDLSSIAGSIRRRYDGSAYDDYDY